MAQLDAYDIQYPRHAIYIIIFSKNNSIVWFLMFIFKGGNIV